MREGLASEGAANLPQCTAAAGPKVATIRDNSGMVAVTHAPSDIPSAERLVAGLGEFDAARVVEALRRIDALYGDAKLSTGEPIMAHVLGMAHIITGLEMDADTRIAALFFSAHARDAKSPEMLRRDFGEAVAQMVEGLHRMNGLRLITRGAAGDSAPQLRAQAEILRKMLLAMVGDIRVVLLRLASRTQTLRFMSDHPGPEREQTARESLDIYAPLANRLGVWQLKWELEDRAFRYLEPETYKRIARLIDERRIEREQFITDAIARLRDELARAGIAAEVYGRPKHIYSIWNKMQKKHLEFSQLFDVRALRVLVGDVKDCYAALGVVHAIWSPIGSEFDDYIAQPKGNHYQSLHTAVTVADGRAMEVQIRTREMHNHAELGFAAHWRYKEGAASSSGEYDQKISLLRELLSWRDEIAGSPDWVEQYKRAALDDTIYVVTPQGRVVDLPAGATPIDFAYRVHTDLGHRCRGAKVNGQMVQLNTPLQSGQMVEITAAKQGGPSRDWLNPQLRFLVSPRARQKVKQWFGQADEEATLNNGRAFVSREMAREGASGANLELLAATLGFRDAEMMFLAAGRGELGPRAIATALRGAGEEAVPPPAPPVKSRALGEAGVLVEGVGKLLTHLGACCKPVPPDLIRGFVTRGKGVSIHRPDCHIFRNMSGRNPERVIEVDWGQAGAARVYSVDIAVEAADRQGLLRDISDVLARERLNVTAVRTLSRGNRADMGFTIEVTGLDQLQRAILLIGEVPSVEAVRRA